MKQIIRFIWGSTDRRDWFLGRWTTRNPGCLWNQWLSHKNKWQWKCKSVAASSVIVEAALAAMAQWPDGSIWSSKYRIFHHGLNGLIGDICISMTGYNFAMGGSNLVLLSPHYDETRVVHVYGLMAIKWRIASSSNSSNRCCLQQLIQLVDQRAGLPPYNNFRMHERSTKTKEFGPAGARLPYGLLLG